MTSFREYLLCWVFRSQANLVDVDEWEHRRQDHPSNSYGSFGRWHSCMEQSSSDTTVTVLLWQSFPRLKCLEWQSEEWWSKWDRESSLYYHRRSPRLRLKQVWLPLTQWSPGLCSRWQFCENASFLCQAWEGFLPKSLPREAWASIHSWSLLRCSQSVSLLSWGDCYTRQWRSVNRQD